ncbi:protein kinase family protein [Bacillus fonticola]|uniref:protein kinase family protein n=1 Tax=Bacillus fonticola TaxID=2728853 RepID=UPI001474FFE2|nr:protein kinase family protein [Bacillus fonticola]
MNKYSELANSVTFTKRKSVIAQIHQDPSLEYIGKGRSAVVFKIWGANKALKVFYPGYTNVAREEAAIYNVLQNSPYYPTLYEAGRNYLVIDLIEGHTLFECLAKGIRVSSDKIKEIDVALNLAREKGLNPSDIHLRNIFITKEGKIKLIDVARFRQAKDCSQWGDLKSAFYKYYSRTFFPKRIPVLILNLIAALYKKNIIPLTKKRTPKSVVFFLC